MSETPMPPYVTRRRLTFNAEELYLYLHELECYGLIKIENSHSLKSTLKAHEERS